MLSATPLTDEEKRQYLRAYSPIVFKGANETRPEYYGHDWLLNFYFDGDSDFANNSLSAIGLLDKIKNKAINFKLNPTAYSFILEFNEAGKKSLTMVYNLYHSRDSASIHDWERVEIRLDDVTENVLTSESVAYVVITRHSVHVAAAANEVQFYNTGKGRHPMIYQAKWNDNSLGMGSMRKNELHFVRDSMATLLASSQAKLKVSDQSAPVNYHYVYIVGSDDVAVQELKAQALNTENADQLYSGSADETIARSQVKSLQYELQDVADILVTHLDRTNPSWSGHFPILMDETPITNPSKSVVASTNNQVLDFTEVANSQRSSDSERGSYTGKHWFWGTYIFNGGNFTDEARDDKQRWQASGKPEKMLFQGQAQHYFWQHDYYVHNRTGSAHWLPYGVLQAVNEGFDGRWSQLFEDTK